jgi:hypothetical protein
MVDFRMLPTEFSRPNKSEGKWFAVIGSALEALMRSQDKVSSSAGTSIQSPHQEGLRKSNGFPVRMATLAGGVLLALVVIVVVFRPASSGSPASSAPNPGTSAAHGGTSPDLASDDDIYRAEARASGEDEAQAVARAHRNKDEDPLTYLTETRNLRKCIKYSGGDAGTTTLEQYVASGQASRAKSEAENVAFQKNAAAIEAQAAKRDALTRAHEKAVEALTMKFDAEEKAIDADYRPRIKAMNSSSEEAQALMSELADKRQAMQERQRQEMANLNAPSK